jgi:putative transposase
VYSGYFSAIAGFCGFVSNDVSEPIIISNFLSSILQYFLISSPSFYSQLQPSITIKGVIFLARKLRGWFPGAKFHITCRGIRKSSLFYDADDFLEYLCLLKETQCTYPFKLYTYCLMSNHTHLQLETLETPTGPIMKNLNTKYAKYFNKKYEYSGHVFEKRYGAELIDSPDYELDVSKYIHLNPFKAGIVEAPEDYPWSSYRAYLHGQESPFIDTTQVLSYFPRPLFKHYQDFVKAPFINPTFPEMEGDLCGQK